MDTPDLEADLDERRIGGLGVHLVRTMMDEVSYTRTNNRNVVVIRKFLRQDTA
jgi:anti-sigma regulatory factor (Ser/Thr protein kinase)